MSSAPNLHASLGELRIIELVPVAPHFVDEALTIAVLRLRTVLIETMAPILTLTGTLSRWRLASC